MHWPALDLISCITSVVRQHELGVMFNELNLASLGCPSKRLLPVREVQLPRTRRVQVKLTKTPKELQLPQTKCLS